MSGRATPDPSRRAVTRAPQAVDFHLKTPQRTRLKAQLASDRTSCQSPLANQFRLVLHTAAYWLMLALRDAVPGRMDLAWSKFATIRQRQLKSLPRTRSGVGARVVEKAARVPIHFASACTGSASVEVVTSFNRSNCYRLERQLLGGSRNPLGDGTFPRRTE